VNYPNREHENADRAARRRAISALTSMSDEAMEFAAKLQAGVSTPYASDAQKFQHWTSQLLENLTILETLREVREWRAADEAEKK
jgi:siroheme synthase (precorrin-2 oxidase/ferrochelatase)